MNKAIDNPENAMHSMDTIIKSFDKINKKANNYPKYKR
jgi:hypothetical protein